MRRKRSIVFVLMIALAVGMFPASAAAISLDARNMENLGLLRGVGDGVNEEFLAQGTQRYQAVVIMARLMGREAELEATDPNAPSFTDAGGTGEFVRRVLAFAYANPELGFQGFPDGSFGPLQPATAQQMYKVLLTTAGWQEGRDFTWAQVFPFATTVGMRQLQGVSYITNDQLATALTEGLRARTADGIGTLGNLLVSRGVISQGQAAAAGVFGGSSAGGGGGGMQLNAAAVALLGADQNGCDENATTVITFRFNGNMSRVHDRDVSITTQPGQHGYANVTRVETIRNEVRIHVNTTQTGDVTVRVGRFTRTVEVFCGAAALPVQDVTLTEAYAIGAMSTTGVAITFSLPVTRFNSDVVSFTGDGSVGMSLGAATGEGARWIIPVTVATSGAVTITIDSWAGDYHTYRVTNTGDTHFYYFPTP